MLRSRTWVRKMRLLPESSSASAVSGGRDHYLSRFDGACDIASEPHVMDSSWCRRGSCDWPREAQFVPMTTAPKKPTVAIVGGGLGGIAMGIQLAHGGYDFTIFDRGDDFGGTWRKTTSPGAACDVPSHFYSYSFALNPRWSKTFADQPEILAYIEKVAADHDLAEHLVRRTRITTLRWSGTDRLWTLTSEDGLSREFDIVVSAVGMLDVPNIPD